MPTELEAASARVEALLAGYRFRAHSEKLLQGSIAAVLAEHDLAHRREHPLAPGSVIDFYLPPSRLGLEVKTKGSLSQVTRQLSRYARHEEVAGLLLITTLQRHRDLPAALHGKPLRVVALAGGLA